MHSTCMCHLKSRIIFDSHATSVEGYQRTSSAATELTRQKPMQTCPANSRLHRYGLPADFVAAVLGVAVVVAAKYGSFELMWMKVSRSRARLAAEANGLFLPKMGPCLGPAGSGGFEASDQKYLRASTRKEEGVSKPLLRLSSWQAPASVVLNSSRGTDRKPQKIAQKESRRAEEICRRLLE